MNTTSRIVRTLASRFLPALAGLLALASTAQAASIRLEVYTQGRWALIVPNSNLGGRIQWDSNRGCYITDRASRGEYLWITKSASTAAERSNPYIYWSDLSSTGGTRPLSAGWLTAYDYTQTPTSPHWDNNHVRICTVSGLYQQRIPVGSR